DYLGTVPQADRLRIALTGHSRNGKQSLIAAALDERIALVISSSSGAGGAMPARYFSEQHLGEGIELLTRRFPDWFHPRLRFFVGREDRLPVDLHELVALKRACYRARNVEVPRSSAQVARWKRDFIRDCLYGVDIKPEAIEIAKLRLWLSLVVDLERSQVEPLPNLDYKLMVGDSLMETVDGQPILAAEAAEGAQGSLGLGATEQAIAELGRLKERFFAAGPEERPELRARIQVQEREIVLVNLRERLAHMESRRKVLVNRGAVVNWQGMQEEKRELERLAADAARLSDLEARLRRGEALPFFLYRLHYFPVFREKGGFDIVIANPPYVRMELIKEQKAALKAAYREVYDGRADLYVYFYARGLELLRPGGVLAYISSNKFMRARYGAGLRALLSEQTTLQRVIDFGDLPVFEATAYPAIVVTRKAKPTCDTAPLVLPVRSPGAIGRLPEEVHAEGWSLPQVYIGRGEWALQRQEMLRLMEKLRAAGRPLAEAVQGQFYMGIKTGLNEAFVIDEATRDRLMAEDPRSAEVIKPWLRGRDVKRWRVEWAGLYVIFTYHGIDIDRYPAIRAHLEPYRKQLEARATSGSHAWYELQQPQMGIYPLFAGPKILYPDMGSGCQFALDARGLYGSNTVYFIGSGDLYLVGILNARTSEFFYRHISASVRGGFLRFFSQHVAQIPVPDAPRTQRRAIEALVRQLLTLPSGAVQATSLEYDLNRQVYRIFGLTPREVALVERS
ncbi:MAG: Eco57I restriction-modification methylase domain-containing protein, partial [Anaerolineae bacterium]|nr:Eco57I restriction-modification methylase domain-containing protein [Anaerolineae bacterium]